MSTAGGLTFVPWPGDERDDVPLAPARAPDGGGAPAAACAAAAAAPAREPDTSPAEVRAFYLIDVANSVYSTVGISGFLPLLIQSAAQAAAGFPGACPNVVRDAALLAAFPGPPRASLFRVAGAGPRACDAPGAPSCWEGLCAGLPATVLECRDALGAAPALLRTRGALAADPTAFATLCVTASVVAQALVFLLLGAAADHGDGRRRALLAASAVGAAACVLGGAALTAETWWLGLPVAVVTNVCFGVTGVMMNAYLTPLVDALPDVRAAPAGAPRAARAAARAAELSSKGFAAGYAAGVAGIALCVPLVAALPEIGAYRATLALTGLWWALFMAPVARALRARPGPPLPPGASFVGASLAGARATAARLRRLPGTAFYLLLWSAFSDAVFVVGTLGGLYANSRVDWGCTPKAYGVLAVFLLVPLCAAAGNLLFWRLAAALRAPPERMLVGILALVGVAVPAWAAAGIRTGADVVGVACLWGLCMGAMQAFSRALFASLTPRGAEAAFFAMYEITNRGSSWVGPLVLTLSIELTGDFALGFAWVAAGALAGAAGICWLDVPRAQRAAALQDEQAAAEGDAEGDAGAAGGDPEDNAAGAAAGAATIAVAGAAGGAAGGAAESAPEGAAAREKR